MYLVPVEVKDSKIDGKGVFALEPIQEGTTVWRFDANHDNRISPHEYANLDDQTKALYERIAYLSPTTKLWVAPPENDPACYTNHSRNPNTKAEIRPTESDEPIFAACKDIKPGEEITNNYLEFDMNDEANSKAWI